MSQLTVAHLFDTFHSLHGPHGPAPLVPSARSDWVGEKLWRISSADGAAEPLIGADELAAAIRGEFDGRHDRVLTTKAKAAAAGSSRELRFDGEHRMAAPVDGANEVAAQGPPDEAAELLTLALGLALARDALAGDHWIVVVLDDPPPGAAPAPELLAALARLRRLLIVCCEPRKPSAEAVDADDCAAGAGQGDGAARVPGHRAPPLSLLDRLASEPGLDYVGPVGGLELDGLLAVFEAVKAIEQSTVLHLWLREEAAPAPRGDAAKPSPDRPVVRRGTNLTIAPETAWPAGAMAPPSEACFRERQQVLARQLSPTIAAWVERYAKLGQRNLYLWKWCLHGLELTTLPCVAPHWRSHARETKFLSGMLNVLVDDVADQQANGALLGQLLKVTSGERADLERLGPAERDCASFAGVLWQTYWERAQEYPCFEVYEELLRYDLAQLFNTVRYSHLLKSNLCLLNLVEHDHYSPQGMGVMTFATVDLMCSPGFRLHDLGRLREAVWHAQWMARIGNMITTWRREVGDRDYTSGVFARAVDESDLTVDDLRQGDPQRIQSAIQRGDHEQYYLERWSYHRDCLRSLVGRIESFDVGLLIEGLDRLLLSELGSRGHK